MSLPLPLAGVGPPGRLRLSRGTRPTPALQPGRRWRPAPSDGSRRAGKEEAERAKRKISGRGGKRGADGAGMTRHRRQRADN